MERRYHIPTSVRWTDEPAADDSRRLQGAVLAAIRRAVEEMANGDQAVPVDTAEPPQEGAAPFSPARYHEDRDTYSIPSYQEGGSSIEVPVAQERAGGSQSGSHGYVPARREISSAAAANHLTVDQFEARIRWLRVELARVSTRETIWLPQLK